jgi:hypothetical protein
LSRKLKAAFQEHLAGFTPGKDSRRIVTDAPALALEVGPDSSSLPLLDGLDLKLGELIAAAGAADQERQHDIVALGFSGHTPTRPESAGKEYVIPLREFSTRLSRMPAKENVAAGGHNRV